MCSLVLSFVPTDPWPVLIGANRDEMLERAWDGPARHWATRPNIIAGRDRLAGGTWLGMNDHGVVAALLNRTGSLGPAPGKASRGELPLYALEHSTAHAAARHIASIDAGMYRSFNMIVIDRYGGFMLRGLEREHPECQPVERGITMMTAGDPNDSRCPRIRRYHPQFVRAQRPNPTAADWSGWIRLLADCSKPAETSLNVMPSNGFGTVCSALVALGTSNSLFSFAAGPPDRAPFHTIDPNWP